MALSGGVDSCVLLDLLALLSREKPKMRLVVLHYDHALQSESSQWHDFCEQLSSNYSCDFFSSNAGVDIDKSIGLEASARRARYEWFNQSIQQFMQSHESIENQKSFKNAILLTAHHADDQAETMLMNILRGTGLKGLRGIAEKKTNQTIRQFNQVLMRPLLNFSKQEISDYAKEKNLHWIEDQSNQDVQFRRNAIRHQIMPELTKIRHDASKQFSRLSRRVSDAEQLLGELAINDLSLTEQYSLCPLDDSYGLGLAGLRVHSVARQINAIRCWLDLIGFPAESEMDLLQVLDWSFNGANSGAELRRGKRCYRYYQDTLYVMPLQDKDVQVGQFDELRWVDSSQALPLTFLNHYDASFELHCDDDSEFFGKELKLLTSDNIQDVYLPNGEGHIQAKKCFQAAKVPPWRRKGALFVVSDQDRFIGLVGGQIQEIFQIKQS